MNALLIDVGNTRIKWAWLTERGLGEQRAEAHAGWSDEVARTQFAEESRVPHQVFISNVAGLAIESMLAKAIEDQWHLLPTFIRSSAKFGNVINGYRNPQQLGVDRWLGVIAAHNLEKRASCVVNVGTAMTVDVINESGLHLGGVIVPGPTLMLKSLFANTSEISTRAREGDTGHDLFADNTLAAVHQGVANALAATVERAAAELQKRTESQPAVLLTGGARDIVVGALGIPFRVVDDLVLKGLAEIARERAEKEP